MRRRWQHPLYDTDMTISTAFFSAAFMAFLDFFESHDIQFLCICLIGIIIFVEYFRRVQREAASSTIEFKMFRSIYGYGLVLVPHQFSHIEFLFHLEFSRSQNIHIAYA